MYNNFGMGIDQKCCHQIVIFQVHFFNKLILIQALPMVH